MKVSEIIQEFVPCEICGNNNLDNFYFYVLSNKGSQAYVKCCECGEKYYSTSARSILSRPEEPGKARTGSRIAFKNIYHESVHPLVKVLARI